MLGDADTVSGTGASVDANTRSSISTLFLIPSIPGVIKQSRLCRRGRGISAKAIQARGWLDGTRLLTSRDYLYRFMYTDSRRCSCTRGFGPLPHHRHPRPHRPRHTLAAPLQGGGGGEGGGGEVAAMVAARGGARGGARAARAPLDGPAPMHNTAEHKSFSCQVCSTHALLHSKLASPSGSRTQPAWSQSVVR